MADQQKKPAGESEEQSREWMRLAEVGVEFVAAIVLPTVVGWRLDQKFLSSPWLVLSGLVLGFATGLFLLVRAARKSFHD